MDWIEVKWECDSWAALSEERWRMVCVEFGQGGSASSARVAKKEGKTCRRAREPLEAEDGLRDHILLPGCQFGHVEVLLDHIVDEKVDTAKLNELACPLGAFALQGDDQGLEHLHRGHAFEEVDVLSGLGALFFALLLALLDEHPLAFSWQLHHLFALCFRIIVLVLGER